MKSDSTLPTASPSLTWRGKLGWVGLFLVALVLVPASLFLTAPLGVVSILAVAILIIAQVGAIAGLIYYPYRDFAGPGPNVRAVEEPRRTEFEALCAELGTTIRGAWVSDDLRDAYDYAQVFGFVPRNRHLFFDTTFFDIYAPDEQRAVVARESELASSYYELFEKTLPFLAALAYFGIEALAVDTVVGSRWPFLPELCALLLGIGGIRYARRQVYRADEFAAERTSPEAVVSALATFADEKRDSDVESIYIELVSRLWTRPSPEKRVDRIRKRFGVEEGTAEE